jgi:hypothetical protein
MTKSARRCMLVELTVLVRRRCSKGLRLPCVCLAVRVEGLLGVCAVPILARCVGCQGGILVQLCFPRRGTIALDIIGEEVERRRVRIDALTLQRYLVTGHVIRGHG